MSILKCSGCGADIQEGIKFCGSCGSTVEPPVAPPAQEVVPEPIPAPVQEIVPEPVAPVAEQQWQNPAALSPPEPPAAPQQAAATFGAPAPAVAVPAASGGSGGIFASIAASLKISNPNIVKFGLLGVIALVAIIFIVIIAALSGGGGGKYSEAKGQIRIMNRRDIGVVTVIPHGKSQIDVEGTLVGSGRSLDGRKGFVLIDEGDGDGYTLYHITGKLNKVSDGVSQAWFSASGNGLAYITEDSIDWGGGTAELWHFNGGSPRKITNNFMLYGPCVLSPNGKIVAYANLGSDGERINGVVWNGKENELGRDVLPAAVSDGARYIYIIRNQETMFVQRGFNQDKRERLGDANSVLMLNRDLSQAIVRHESRSVISIKGRERQNLSGIVEGFLTPRNAAAFSSGSYIIYGIDSFAHSFYVNSNSDLVRVNGKFETSNVIRNIDDAYLAADGKTVLYLRNDSIFKVNGRKQNAEPNRLVDGNVMMFIATSKGNAVFYIDDEYDVFFKKGNSRPSNIFGEYTSRDFPWGVYGGFYALYKGSTLFLVYEEEIYSSSGSKAQKIRGIEDVTAVSAGMFDVLVTTNDHGDIIYYHSTNGRRFGKLN